MMAKSMFPLLALAILSLASCGPGPDDCPVAKAEAERGWWHYRNLTAKTEEVDTSVANLRLQLDRMDTENWADVMPDLRAAMEEVEADQKAAYDASAL